MSVDDKREQQIEQVTAAWRPRDATGHARPHPAWHDLSPEDRRQATERAAESRILEAALDPKGYSSTVRTVLAHIRSGQT